MLSGEIPDRGLEVTLVDPGNVHRIVWRSWKNSLVGGKEVESSTKVKRSLFQKSWSESASEGPGEKREKFTEAIFHEIGRSPHFLPYFFETASPEKRMSMRMGSNLHASPLEINSLIARHEKLSGNLDFSGFPERLDEDLIEKLSSESPGKPPVQENLREADIF